LDFFTSDEFLELKLRREWVFQQTARTAPPLSAGSVVPAAASIPWWRLWRTDAASTRQAQACLFQFTFYINRGEYRIPMIEVLDLWLASFS
jgi:hypothetical protein